jgi:hypothetical protein
MTMIVPSVVMIGLAVISFTDLLSDIDGKELFVVGLLLLFPLLFLGQGVACGLGKGNIIISLLTSTVIFVVISLVSLNASALVYIALYLVAGLVGFVLARLTKRQSHD